jgi:hypothetical protein
MGYPLRYLLLVTWTLFATVVAFSWMIRLPLALGRKSLSVLRLPDGQDFYNYTVGVALMGAANLAFRYVWRECLAQPGFVAAVRTGIKWLWLLAKVVTLAVLWLTVIPLMLGVIFELVLVIPLRLPVDETPKLPFAQVEKLVYSKHGSQTTAADSFFCTRCVTVLGARAGESEDLGAPGDAWCVRRHAVEASV